MDEDDAWVGLIDQVDATYKLGRVVEWVAIANEVTLFEWLTHQEPASLGA